MSKLAGSLRHKGERRYHFMMLVLGPILWALVLSWVWKYWDAPKLGHYVQLYVAYFVGFTVFMLLMSAAYRASAFGNMVLVGPNQFPELHQMVVDGSREIGLSKAPTTFIYNSNGLFNAFARRLLGGRYVFLTSALVEANNDAQVRFVIGHELGHHAAGHLNPWLNTLKLPAHIVPFLGKAYSRSREYTCDTIGAYLSKDAHASRGALQMLGCGCRRLNPQMNCEAFAAQEAMVPPIFGFLTEINRTHPRLTRRVAAIGAGVTQAQSGMPEFIGDAEPRFMRSTGR
ncbi:peptidase [Trinickia dabaoshanensis]|uniref:Peptidase n=1 Tax=Trinickia dabaoshanensis TaxID=564714 RepID=A0A2N7VVG2_9BURK|nr:M48 family metallopeptidase [Trinickia dabaoshanensis]PMS21123.1 peptidase [Trinickia dabaoshanensis]